MGFYNHVEEYMIETATGPSPMPSMHYHDSYELYYLITGSRQYYIEDKLFSVNSGSFVLIEPGTFHRTDGETVTRTLVYFTRAFLERHFTKSTADWLLQCYQNMLLVPEEQIRRDCNLYLRNIQESQDEHGFALWLALLLSELGKCPGEKPKNDIICQIISYINENYRSITKLETIADKFFISKAYLCRLFSKAVNATVMDYLNQVRIRNAQQLLELTNLDISEISSSSGFRSSAYFSSVFKKFTGETPTQFRNRCRAGRRK